MRANISNFVILLLIISFNSQSFSSDKDIALHIEGEYMSVNLKDVPINAIFRILNRLKGIAVEGDVSMLNQNITVKFKNLTFEQSLKRILNRFNHSLYFNSKGDVISVFLLGKK